MTDFTKFLINGKWVDPTTPNSFSVINPATEEAVAEISMGSQTDVDKAVAAAKAAFPAYSATSREERVALLEKFLEIYKSRLEDVAQLISQEMGAPITLSRERQAWIGIPVTENTIQTLKTFKFEEDIGTTRIRKEPIGVCGFITPWNWPINQIVNKVMPALAAGCTIVLKPSELAPLDAFIFAEAVQEAGYAPGVFNLINGDGPSVGAAISAHPEIDMVSFTGSTRAGIEVARAAADTVKRVSQELGGKSANIVLDEASLEKAVTFNVGGCFMNSGQSCNAPTRLLVPEGLHAKAVEIATAAAANQKPGDTSDESTTLGPVVSKAQFDKIQTLIQKGIDEGAELIVGGTGKPEGIDKGHYVKPTIFANVKNDMTISREEIFGPVLTILPYKDVDEAIEIANDTPYGLSGYVFSDDLDEAVSVASRMRTGQIHVNGNPVDFGAPFGGYKMSGNGRERGVHGMNEFLETKAMMGAIAAE